MPIVSSPPARSVTPAHSAVPRPLAWVLVVHPDAEVAHARAGLAASAVGAPGLATATTGRELFTQLPDLRGHGAVLVHVDGLERFRAGWGGHRLIRRVREAGHDTVLGWVAEGDREAAALAVRCGATGLITMPAPGATAPRERVRMMHRALTAPALELPPASGEPPIEEWFAARYGVAWRPWMEQAVAMLASGGERGEQAELLRPALHPATSEHAQRRLRQLAEVLGGEVRGNEVVLRREALTVLARIGRQRPVDAEPLVVRSLQRAAAALQRWPELVVDAGLSREAAHDLLAVAAIEQEMLSRATGRRGRPEAGAWRLRRNRAIARVAERRGTTAAEKLDLVRLLDRRVGAAIDAVHDALDDRERIGLIS